VASSTRQLAIASSALAAEVEVALWCPTARHDGEPLPMLVAHDGPELDRRAGLTRFLAAEVAANRLPRHRIALLQPGDRDQWYSASALYARALVTRVLPAIGEAVAVERCVGMGASLGALAMLHAHRRFPHAFAGLFLQSGSFFVPRFDAHESGFVRYRRIVRFVRRTLREPPRRTVPVTLTCAAREENVHNNRLMASALAAQGYRARLIEGSGVHDFTAWRDMFDPHLTALLQDVWAR
jgi:enterochelin esterase-like enzyme